MTPEDIAWKVVERIRCANDEHAADMIINLLARAHAEGKAEGMKLAAADCEAAAALVPGTSMSIGLRAQAIAIRALAPHVPAGEERPAMAAAPKAEGTTAPAAGQKGEGG